MSPSNKNRILSILLIICFISIGVMGYSLWNLNKLVEKSKAHMEMVLKKMPDVLLHNPIDNDGIEKELTRLQSRLAGVLEKVSPDKESIKDVGANLFINAPKLSISEVSSQYLIEIKIPEGQEFNVVPSVKGKTLTLLGRVISIKDATTKIPVSLRMKASEFTQSFILSSSVNVADIRTIKDGNKILISVPKN